MSKISLVSYTVEEALEFHKNNLFGNGKIEVLSRVGTRNSRDLTLAYTPGVAEPCKAIHKDVELVHDYTAKDNMVAIVTDGTAVLGLGNIGPEAALPVMEGKVVLFKMLAGVDAFPLCLRTAEVEEIISIVKNISPGFGGINLEDISAPRCFTILERLRNEMDIPVFHDDQHGTAVVVMAALINALKLVGKRMSDVKVVIHGAGASGQAVALLLLAAGIEDVSLADRAGAIYRGRSENMNEHKVRLAEKTNKDGVKGSISDLLKGADVFLGLSSGGKITQADVKLMKKDPIVFALANPIPEIYPEDAKEAGARIVATGRSDYANQINNVLGFPGIFRGALDVRATDVNEAMIIAAAESIASLIPEKELKEDYIITTPLDPKVMPLEAVAVAKAAMDSGVARKPMDTQEISERTKRLVEINAKRFDFAEEMAKDK